MGEAVRALHGELRGLLQGPRSDEGWRALLGQLKRVYPSEDGGSTASILTAGEQEQFEEEVLPAVRRELERGWPAELCAVRQHDHERVRSVGRTLYLALDAHEVRRFAEARGIKFSRLTKKTLAELVPLWLAAGQFEGLILSFMSYAHVEVLDALLDGGLPPVRHVRLERVAPPKDGSGLEPLIARLVERCGQTLESFGATMHWDHQRDPWGAVYEAFAARGDALPRLRHINFCGLNFCGPYKGPPNPFVQVMANRAFDRLDTVRVEDLRGEEVIEALVSREASRNLRRVSGGYVSAEVARALLEAPNLANVEVWDLHSGSAWHEGWETPEAAKWRAHRAGNLTPHALDQALLDLHGFDALHTEEVLFEGERLRPSPRLLALRVEDISPDALDRLIEQAPAAWPNLECLIINARIERAQTHELIERSSLLHTLRYLSWDERDAPAQETLNAASAREKTLRAACLELLERALDPDVPPMLAHRMFCAVRSWATRRVAVCTALEDALGLSEHTRDMNALEAAFIAKRGGPAGMMLGVWEKPLYRNTPLVWPPVPFAALTEL
jgi:hypothetical protein